MTDRIDAVRAYIAAQDNRTDEAVAALAPLLADDVVARSVMGVVEGHAAVLADVGNPTRAALFAGASVGEPATDGDVVTVKLTAAPGGMVGGVHYTFGFDASDRIASIGAQMIAAPSPPATAMDLGPEIAEAVDGALANGTPMLVAYVDGEDVAHLSYRGTTQVFSPDQLALWARDPEGGLPRAVLAKPKLTLMYRDTKTRANYTFYGRARVTTDDAERTRIYDASPERERNSDPGRRGVALVVDIDRVEGMGPAGRVHMQRGAPPTAG